MLLWLARPSATISDSKPSLTHRDSLHIAEASHASLDLAEEQHKNTVPPKQVVSVEKTSTFTLDASTAEIRVGNQSIKLRSSDGLFDRMFIPLEKTTSLRVRVPNLVSGAEVQIAAPNGGMIKRTNGPMRFTPESTAPVDLNLEFTPNLGRGAYTVTIRQAGAVMTFDFWAGESTPIGKPGPSWTPAPDAEETVP